MSVAACVSLTVAGMLTPDAARPVAIEPETPAQILRIDAARASVNFEIAALWILRRSGHFGTIDGTLNIATGGDEAQMRVRIAVDSVHMKDPDHVELLLSPAFFDADRHPWIEFESAPFLLSGESRLPLPGQLTVRGIRQAAVFNLDLRHCRPGPPAPCKVIVDGMLQRSLFGMTEYRRTLADQVHLQITAVVVE